AIQSVRLAYIDKNADIIERIYYVWVSVFIFRSKLVWIDSKDKKDLDLIISQLLNLDLNDIKKKYQVKRQYFITYQSYFCVEINAHSLIYLATLVCEGKLPFEALNISLQNSQTCEGMFQSSRATLNDFWSSDLGIINSETGSNEIGSENEINSEDQSNVVYDIDEEFELNDHLNVSDDINVSSYQGIRLFDNVKQELAHSYFKVSVNNATNIYINKQHAEL
ncbi:unnamed protein product, partial [Rotaria magnacalcarata]